MLDPVQHVHDRRDEFDLLYLAQCVVGIVEPVDSEHGTLRCAPDADERERVLLDAYDAGKASERGEGQWLNRS